LAALKAITPPIAARRSTRLSQFVALLDLQALPDRFLSGIRLRSRQAKAQDQAAMSRSQGAKCNMAQSPANRNLQDEKFSV
jgi:hypothetical protein